MFTPVRAGDPAVHQQIQLGPFCFTHWLSCPWPPVAWEHQQHRRLLGGRAAASLLLAQNREQGKERQSNQRQMAQARALTASWPWQHPPVSMWIILKQGNVWRGSMGSSFMPRLQRKHPSVMGAWGKYWYQSQLGCSHSSSCSSLKAICLIASWVMNKSQETRASHSSCLTSLTPHTANLASCLLWAS